MSILLHNGTDHDFLGYKCKYLVLLYFKIDFTQKNHKTWFTFQLWWAKSLNSKCKIPNKIPFCKISEWKVLNFILDQRNFCICLCIFFKYCSFLTRVYAEKKQIINIAHNRIQWMELPEIKKGKYVRILSKLATG